MCQVFLCCPANKLLCICFGPCSVWVTEASEFLGLDELPGRGLCGVCCWNLALEDLIICCSCRESSWDTTSKFIALFSAGKKVAANILSVKQCKDEKTWWRIERSLVDFWLPVEWLIKVKDYLCLALFPLPLNHTFHSYDLILSLLLIRWDICDAYDTKM